MLRHFSTSPNTFCWPLFYFAISCVKTFCPSLNSTSDTTQFPTASTLCCWRVFLSDPLFPPNQCCTSIAATTVSSRRASTQQRWFSGVRGGIAVPHVECKPCAGIFDSLSCAATRFPQVPKSVPLFPSKNGFDSVYQYGACVWFHHSCMALVSSNNLIDNCISNLEEKVLNDDLSLRALAASLAVFLPPKFRGPCPSNLRISAHLWELKAGAESGTQNCASENKI